MRRISDRKRRRVLVRISKEAVMRAGQLRHFCGEEDVYVVLVTRINASYSSEESSTTVSHSSRLSAFQADTSEAHSTSRSVVFVSSESLTQMVG
jgi:hypothetical protein